MIYHCMMTFISRIIRTLLLIILMVTLSTIVLLKYRELNRINPRNAPKYKGIDPKVYPLFREYVKLGRLQGVKFNHLPTIGFTNINAGPVVGITFYGNNFREIDLDVIEWNNNSPIFQRNLLFHELTHAMCTRGHDYGDGKEYPPTYLDQIKIFKKWRQNKEKSGMYEDGCPLSIMYPYVLKERCILAHQKEYELEMFNRCEPF